MINKTGLHNDIDYVLLDQLIFQLIMKKISFVLRKQAAGRKQ